MSVEDHRTRAQTIERLREIILNDRASATTILVDGPSGSGKTSLVKDLLKSLPEKGSFEVISMEDLYAGWDGLASGNQLLLRLLDERLHTQSAKNPATVTFAPWDWEKNMRDGQKSLDPLLPWIIEGCGSLSEATSKFSTWNVWVQRPFWVRLCAVWRRDRIPLRTWLHWERSFKRFVESEQSYGLVDTYVNTG